MRVDLSKETQAAYVEVFLPFSNEEIQRGFDRTIATWDRPNQMPPPAIIVRHMSQPDDTMAAEQAWMDFKKLFKNHWHPDVGFYGDYPRLSPAGEYAMRVIGGVTRFAETEIQHEGFIRKEFIEAFHRFKETGGYLGPTREEAKAFIEKLQNRKLPE
jgi:hypothetical protein